MLPVVNPRGSSFKGITSYLLYGKERTETPERVEWSHTGNMHTNDPEKAAKVMAFTAMHAEDLKRESGGSLAGTKAEGKSAYHNSLSWRTGDAPSQEHMKEAALDYIKYQGLSGHEYYIVAHNDTDHKHVHIVVNLVNPETGKTIKLGKDKEAARDWALEYEREHGIQCQLREDNAAKRERGEHTKYQDQKQDYSEKITRAYYASDNGKSFINALDAEGLQLAKSRRGNNFIIVDEKGDIQKFARQLDIEERGKAKTAAIQAKLSDIDREQLPDGDALSRQIKADLKEQSEPYDRDAEEIKQQKALEDAAHKAGEEKARLQDAEEAAEKQHKTTRIEILKGSKNEWSVLKELQNEERTALVEKLREQDSVKEAVHRAHWQEVIRQEEQEKAALQDKLDQSGYGGMWYRFRHGKETREEIGLIDKNIQNAMGRLSEGVGGLNAFDFQELERQKAVHEAQRAELQNRVTEALRIADEQAALKRDDLLLQEAERSREDAQRLQYSVTAKTEQQKEAAARVDALAETNKQQEKDDMAKRAGMSSLDEWRLDGLSSIVEDAQTKDPRRNEVREEITTPNAKHDFYKSADEKNSQVENENVSAASSSEMSVEERKAALVEQYIAQASPQEQYRDEQLEEMREVFAERREEIENSPDYSDTERQQALDDLEYEYEQSQSQHLEQNIERDYDQGMER